MSAGQGKVILVFPGQGAQYPGMGSDLFGAFDSVRELYEQALDVVFGASLFTDIDPNDDEPPQEWVDKWGAKRAMKLLASARFGHLTKKDAPVGLQVAIDMAKSERRARSTVESGPKQLNIAVVAMPKFHGSYEIVDVDGSEE